MSERETVVLERGYVLHHRPYRNTSQLLECLTAQHGRVGLIAQGSRSAKSERRALLQLFVPLRLSWVRRGELGRLTAVEGDTDQIQPEDFGSIRLLAGSYVNEVILRLSVRGDGNEEVFSCYSRCVAALAASGSDPSRALRLFELGLLQALGYGIELERDVETGQPLRPDVRYRYVIERGLTADDRVAEHEGYWGRELIALRAGELDDMGSLRAARRLLAHALSSYLGDRPLKSREVLKDILARGL